MQDRLGRCPTCLGEAGLEDTAAVGASRASGHHGDGPGDHTLIVALLPGDATRAQSNTFVASYGELHPVYPDQPGGCAPVIRRITDATCLHTGTAGARVFLYASHIKSTLRLMQ